MAQPTSSDQDLWKIYAGKIKEQFLQGQSLGPSNRFYIPPLNTAGITAGPSTSQPITNYGLAVAGDSLVSPDNPLFVPSNDTYSKKVLNYLRNVQLSNNVDSGLKQVRDQRQKDLETISEKVSTLTQKARADWASDPDPGKAPFKQWINENYPQLVMELKQRDAAAGGLNQILSQIQGPGWEGLSNSIKFLENATNYIDAYPPYNMEVDSSLVGAAADTGSKAKQYRPSYNFGSSATYPQILDDWVQKASQSDAKKTEVSFKLSESSKYNWSDLGHSNTSFDASVGFGPFFSASYSYNGQEQHETVSVQSNDSSIAFKISATGIQAFDVAPDNSWNPGNVKQLYPRLFENANKNLLGPMMQVRKVVIGYNVDVSITLDQGTYNSIKQATSKATSQGGSASASIFGFNINLGGRGSYSSNESTDLSNVTMSDSDFTITFPGANNRVPLLLGVLATEITA